MATLTSKSSRIWQVINIDIISVCYQFQVCIFSGWWDMAKTISRSIWPWPNISRSLEVWQVIHNDIISLYYQSQVCIFCGYWNIVNWKISRPVWPWPNFPRSSEIWQVDTIESSLIVINHKPVSLAVTEIWLNENIEGQIDLDLIFSRS